MIPSDGRVLLPVTSPTPSAFPKSLWWVGFPESARTKRLRAEGISRSSPFLTFRPPGLFATQFSPTAAPKRPQRSRDFSTRANHTSLPMCASGMLAVRNRQLTAERLSLSQTCSLVGRYRRDRAEARALGHERQSHVSSGPPAIPEGRISRFRFSPWLSPRGLSETGEA